jgi:uroporphyrinogen-III synthase
VIAEELARAGARVDAVIAYAKRPSPAAPARARDLFGESGPLGWVTFTSPAIARAFAALFGPTWPARRPTLRAASIGPVTSAELRRLGVEPAAEAAAAGDTELAAAVAAAQSCR